MALIGNLISRSLRIRKKFTFPRGTPKAYQIQVIHRLLEMAKGTEFGRHYHFEEFLRSPDWLQRFRQTVPVHNYQQIFEGWWYRCMNGELDITWPGKVSYFALSSGTSEFASKHIPVTRDMLKTVKKVGIKQLYSLVNFQVPPRTFEKGILMLGGTTSLDGQGKFYEGDMSGISAKNIPRWFRYFYKPGSKISQKTNWEQRISLIVRKAPQWDVGTICGVPAWVQIVFERIIEYHGVKHIHEIWPNLAIYIHGGVAFEPYRESINQLLGQPLTFIETYMASEGSFGFQARPGTRGIKLVLNAGIFFEFIPFNTDNFDQDGELGKHPRSLLIDEVVEGVDYAVVLTTCAGAWRYLIGDVLRFTSVAEHEIVIVGRTKQFLNLCGEHLSIENMNRAIDQVSRQMNLVIREFAVAGIPYQNLFAHHWYIGMEGGWADAGKAREILDHTLKTINDDYAVGRTSALREILVDFLPNDYFIRYLRKVGKEGAMNKFPRVLKNSQLEDWENFLKTNHQVA
ncbi:MAG: GH3 family acyl-acid amido synthetase [Chitinophagaceae bacterium]